MPSISEVKRSNSTFSPSYTPVAVFFGGTSGIGHAMVEAFAKYTEGRAHIIIIGRNAKAAETLFKSLPKPEPTEGQTAFRREFLSCDLLVLKNLKKTADELAALGIEKVNFLVLSAGFGHMAGGRVETEDGLERQMVARYYSRWKFIQEVMPLLEHARDLKEDAKVMSILAAGQGDGKINVKDLALKEKYSAKKVMLTTPTYTDYAFEKFANEHKGISFIHIYPGLVDTPGVDELFKNHWSDAMMTPLLKFSVKLLAASPPDAAQYMLYALFTSGEGFNRRSEKGDSILSGYKSKPEDRDVLWKHTQEVTTIR